MAKSVKQLIAAGDRATIKKAMNTPAWRHLLSSEQVQKYKSFNPKAAQLRATKDRLAAPITTGSSTTERDLAREAHANLDLEYGPQESQLRQTLGETQQRARDTGSFYDDYIARLGQHQQNLANIGQQTSNQLVGTLAGVTGLSAANLTQLQNPAVQDAQARGATAGDLSQMANNAATTRQALLGSFAAQEAVKDQARTIYGAGQANVVAPAQKLTAQVQAAGKTAEVRKKQADLVRERAAADVKFRAGRRSEEAKNILAQSIAEGKTVADLTKAKLQSSTSIKTANIRATTADKQIAAAATQKQADRDLKAALGADKAHQPNKYGVPADQWATWSTSHRTRVINQKAGKTKTDTAAKQFEDKYGVKPAGQAAVSKAQSTISEAKNWLGQIGGNLDVAGQTLTRGQAKGKGADEPAIPKLPAVFVRVAMDQKRMGGYISASTADRLHRAGYSVATLGLKTKPDLSSANSRAYGRGGAGTPNPQGHL